MAKKLTKAEKVAKMDPQSFGRLKGEAGRAKLEGYLKTLRYGYKRRAQAIKKSGLYSHAMYQFEDVPGNLFRSYDKMTNNQIIAEIIRLSNFFNSRTASVQGIREVNKEQDRRIFGETKTGKPLQQMTESERKLYWALYNEYFNNDSTRTSKFGSNSVQQTLADMLVEEGDPNDRQSFFDRLDQKLNAQKNKQNEAESYANVFSGRGSPR